MPEGSDFYEDDEPVEKIRAAFDRGDKGLTGKRPRDLNQLAAPIVDATEPGPVEDRVAVPTDLSSFTIEGVRFEGEAQRFQLPVKAR